MHPQKVHYARSTLPTFKNGRQNCFAAIKSHLISDLFDLSRNLSEEHGQKYYICKIFP